MALDWHNNNNPNYFTPFHFQDPIDILFSPPSPIETQLLCFDPLPPPQFQFDDPTFNTPSFPPFEFNDLFIPTDDFTPPPPPLFRPADDIFSFNEDYNYDYDYNNNPFAKKQKVSAFDVYDTVFAVPEIVGADNNVGYQQNYVGNGYVNEGYGENCDNNIHNGGDNKVKVVSAQSKAARERRRKITEKTHELGKLIPGGNKLNTAEMLTAASKYVKFMQAQLGILQSVQTLHQDQDDSDKKTNLKNLPILSSQLVQEKLYTKDKCLIPLDYLPKLEEHCDSETSPLISQQINDLLN